MGVFEKIFNKINAVKLASNDQILAYLNQVKTVFNKRLNELESKSQLIDILQSLILEISQLDSYKFEIYKIVNTKENLWQSLLDNKKYYLKNTNHSTVPGDTLIWSQNFTKQEDTSNTEETKEMLVVNLPEENNYIVELCNVPKDRLVYFYIKSELQNFINDYLKISEVEILEKEKRDTEKKYHESEKRVAAANKEIRRKVYELHNLVEASNDIYSILDFKQLINSSLLTIIGQVGFQKAFMLLYDKESQLFNLTYHKGFLNQNFDNLQFDLTSPMVSYFFKNRTPLYVSRLEQNKNTKEFAKKLKKLGILVLAPLIYSERLQGIVGAGEKLQFQEFTEADFEIFHILVNIISISIGNARMFQEIKTLSLTDAMTNLNNYRYFEDRLKEELNRAHRHGKKVSLMILDIDHFKNYNDTLGHQAGDEVLRLIGKLLKDTIRDEDIVARYGGEEFCIILPGITKKGIPILGERVRKRIESEIFFKEEVQPGGKLTISIGTATFPEDAKNFNDLVEKADIALYQAKNAGRNQIKVFDG